MPDSCRLHPSEVRDLIDYCIGFARQRGTSEEAQKSKLLQRLAKRDSLPRQDQPVPPWVGRRPVAVEVHKSGAVTLSPK